MDNLDEKYHEGLLHWIWDTLHFELRNLHTACGQPVTILDRGNLNPSDGPDFNHARLQIGDLQWHGDIEFHWSAAGWKHHGHQKDPEYNQVILHVVYYDPAGYEVSREDDTTPFMLHLRPHLPENLERLLSAFHQTDRLPCAEQIHYISQHAVEQQFEQAHREYFETKTAFILDLYDSDLPPSTAWKKGLSLGLFDGLGISLNREPMLKTGRLLHDHMYDGSKVISSAEELQALALRKGGFGEDLPDNTDWNYKGCRPNNHPELRVRQAAALTWKIYQTPLNKWYNGDPQNLWDNLLNTVDTPTGIGTERGDILYGIVFLPALWLLGNLFHIDGLKQRSFNRWMSHQAQLPSSLFRLFARSGIPPELYEKRLGAVHQLKHYCKPRRCNQCIVLKEIISS